MGSLFSKAIEGPIYYLCEDGTNDGTDGKPRDKPKVPSDLNYRLFCNGTQMPNPFRYGKVWCKNGEQALCVGKAYHMWDGKKMILVHLLEKIARADTHKEAAEISQSRDDMTYNPCWEKIVMSRIGKQVEFRQYVTTNFQIAKALYNPEFCALLLRTKNRQLIENDPTNMVWGGEGRNLHGEATMDARTELRAAFAKFGYINANHDSLYSAQIAVQDTKDPAWIATFEQVRAMFIPLVCECEVTIPLECVQ